jgi:Protein of unknown function (DUF1579)
MKTMLAAVFMLIILGNVASICAQSSPQKPPSPSPELREQDYFVGTWRLTGETKAGPFGPGGQKFDSTERLEWMPGGFFLVAHSYDRDKLVGLTIIGYDENAKVLTHTTYNAGGKIETMRGTTQGETVIFSQDGTVKGKPVKERMTIKKVSPELYTFKFEIAPEGGDWSLVYEGKGVKTP